MITRLSLELAATHHGIFASPTLSGRSGAALLASLNFDLGADDACEELRGLIASGAVTPVVSGTRRSVTERKLQAALVERGLPPEHASLLARESWLGDTYVPDRWCAFLLPAWLPSPDSLHPLSIRRMREWLGDREDAPARHLRASCSLVLGETIAASTDQLQRAREICAQWWARYAGVMQ